MNMFTVCSGTCARTVLQLAKSLLTSHSLDLRLHERPVHPQRHVPRRPPRHVPRAGARARELAPVQLVQRAPTGQHRKQCVPLIARAPARASDPPTSRPSNAPRVTRTVAARTALPSMITGLQRIANGSDALKVDIIAISYKPFLSLFNMTGVAEANPSLAGIGKSTQLGPACGAPFRSYDHSPPPSSPPPTDTHAGLL